MKKFRWILLSGLLVATTQIVQAQPPGGPSNSFPGQPSPNGAGAPGSTTDAGAITNTTTTTTTAGVPPVAPDSSFTPADNAAIGSSDSLPNTGGEPMIAVFAGLTIAGAALAMRRKVTA